MKKEEKIKYKNHRMIHLVLVFALFVSVLGISSQSVKASVWNNAYTYYSTYGNSVVFRPMTSTDGMIYYATKAKKASTSTVYRTLGWKVSIKNMSGSTLQTLYFKLGGSYMYVTDTVTKNNYEYNLFSLSLYQLKGRLNSKATTALTTGKANIELTACMTIVKNGSVKGRMNDSGPVSGQVYTSYSGIANAANWSNSSKQSLYNYFNKEVEDLFYQVDVTAGEGIKSVSGSGWYCYGTDVSVQAWTKTGYEFSNWTGLLRGGYISDHFIVNESGRCIAIAEPKMLRIYYHRNWTQQDSEIYCQTVRYNTNGAKLENCGWRKDGKLALGWALASTAGTAKYKVDATISSKWIDQNAPTVHLYAVWEKTDPTPGPMPNPTPTPTPTPTPSEPTPTPDPPPTPTPPGPTPTPGPQPTDPENGSDPENKKTTTKRIVRCRFISSQYFEDEHENLIPQERGGLAPDSVWATDSVRRQILRYALRKA